jgi:hypothetical protein
MNTQTNDASAQEMLVRGMTEPHPCRAIGFSTILLLLLILSKGELCPGSELRLLLLTQSLFLRWLTRCQMYSHRSCTCAPSTL